jgi:predicted DNA-binding transcriptional regulator YafY
MSKRESNKRLILIINRIRRGNASFNEVCKYLKEYSDFDDADYNISQRTFQRDLIDIRSIYNIDIQYNRSSKTYYIEEEDETGVYDRIFEAVDTINALNVTESVSKYIDFEKRKPKGTEHLYGIIHALKNTIELQFMYQKFWDASPSLRKFQPFALKDFNNRWYVIGKDLKDNRIKTFSLDRISLLQFTDIRYKVPADFNIQRFFEFSFGIINPDDLVPEEIILSFDAHQGKYIKTLPIHHSQKVLIDTDKELQISLFLSPTYDFKMEVLSYGNRVKVLSPTSFVEEIKAELKETLQFYSE